MKDQSEDPYSPPVRADNASPERDAEQTEASSKPSRFRWRMIPATLSWFIAVTLALVCVMWAYETVAVFQGQGLDQDGEPIVNQLGIGVSVTTVLFAACVLNGFAGFRWLRGRWVSAIAVNVSSFVVVIATMELLHRFTFGA